MWSDTIGGCTYGDGLNKADPDSHYCVHTPSRFCPSRQILMEVVCEAAEKWRAKRLTVRPGDVDRDLILLEVDLQNAVEAWKKKGRVLCAGNRR